MTFTTHVAETPRCPVCLRAMSQGAAISVDCGHDLRQIMPSATRETVLTQIASDDKVGAPTRAYPEGRRTSKTMTTTRDQSPGAILMLWDDVEERAPAIRLAERSAFRTSCCSDCKADLLALLSQWARGRRQGEASRATGPNAPVPLNAPFDADS